MVHRRPAKDPATYNKTRFGTGRKASAFADGRSATERRKKELIAEYSRPFGPFQTLDTDTQDLILDRAAAQVGIELLQAEAAARKPIDHGEMAKYLNAKNRARRGLNKRLPKPAEPKDALAEHLARTYGSAAE